MVPVKFAGALAFGLALAAAQPAAAVTQILAPTTDYLADTTKLDFTVDDGQFVTSLSDADLSVSFDSVKAATVGVTWLSWGAPPDTEDAFPRVLFAEGLTTLTFNFSKTLSTFGFEAEPDVIDGPFSVSYYKGGALQGTIGRDIGYLFDAKLLAATGEFDKVVVTASDQFAFGQVRYAVSAVPEPGAWALMIVGFGAVGAMARARRYRVSLAA